MNKKNKKNNGFSSSSRTIIIVLVVAIGGILILSKLTDYTRNIQSIPYSTFLKKIEEGEVRAVHVSGNDVYGALKNGTKFETVIADIPANWELLKNNNVEFSVASASGQFSWWYLLSFIFNIGILLAIVWFFFRQSRGMSGGGGGVNVFSIGKSRAKMFMPSTIKENFDSVAGASEAKEELKDVVDFLRNPEKYRRLGAKITRGVLLVGEPGNGKTLLAKAVAGEANCPFFSISGSDFIEVFVGVGAARVRDLFMEARKNAPCIIFIDEIDAVGRQRGTGLGGGHDEREQTLNQLLSEMDGFQTVGGAVIVLAATNRPDVLDKALLRPGRFDRRVEVPYPDLVSREQILRLHAKQVPIAAEVDLKKVARGTPGFSGADLANIINEAAIIASKKGQDEVFVADFEEARDKITLGKERKTLILSPKERETTAYHEAGHAMVILLKPEDAEPLHKVTIIPRGPSLGVTHWIPERDKYTRTEREMRVQIMIALGGRVAEKLVFNELGTGAYDDFKKATEIVRSMVCYYGMVENLGPVVYGERNSSFWYSEKTAEEIDAAVIKIMHECEATVTQLLQENRAKLNLLAQTLLEKETLYSGEIYTLLGIEPRQEHSF